MALHIDSVRRIFGRSGPRQAVLVLGMHRSGTSALARVVSLLGAELPESLLPATPDNEAGYWESPDIVDLNDALLEAAGTTWYDAAAIPDRWFASEVPRQLRQRARALLDHNFSRAPIFVLKDPRLCRLVPFWQSMLRQLGVATRYLVILREPEEVYRSLATRGRFGHLAIENRERCYLLWLRYVLEAERQTRDLDHAIVTYRGLLGDWPTVVRRMAQQGRVDFPVPLQAARPAIDGFLSDHLRHHRLADPEVSATTSAGEVHHLLAAHAEQGTDLDRERLDAVRNALDAVDGLYRPLREPTPPATADEHGWSAEMLERVRERAAPMGPRPPRILYVSQRPDTRGHAYRVAHHVDALLAAGFDASWVRLEDDVEASADGADVVVVFREPWSPRLERVFRHCRDNGVLVGIDFDDLVFDPAVMTVESFPYLRRLADEARARWVRNAGLHRDALVEADFALVSTQPLADAAEALGVATYVLPNGISPSMIAAADEQRAAKPVTGDGWLRLGYASGTPTHQRDFGTVAEVLGELLEANPSVMVTVVGYLDLDEFPELLRHGARIERREHVPHDQLFHEYARFDVNLALLEPGNPFCEGKSELKYFEAALVETPTVAAATLPFERAVRDGDTGLLASTPQQWRSQLQRLIDDRHERVRLGRRARLHALAAFGPDTQSAAARRTFTAVARDVESRRPSGTAD